MSVYASIAELQGLLEATGYTVYDHVPSHQLEGSCLVIEARDPFLTPGDTFNTSEWLANLTIWVLVPLTDEYDVNRNAFLAALEQVISKLESSPWGIDAIGRPSDKTAGEWLAWGAGVQVSNFTNINP